MRTFEKVWKTVGIFLIIVIGGAMLLTLAYLVPINENNKIISDEIMEKEGWYPAIPVASASLDTYFHSYLPGVLDNGSERVILSMVFSPREKNALRAAMDMNDYARCWNGYVSFLRPLLMLFDYGEMRVCNAMMQLLLVAMLFIFIYQKMGIKYALLLLTSYCFLMPMVMPFCLHYSWVFYITYIFVLYLISRKEGLLPDGIKLYWLFMIVGMLTSYLDLIAYPLYTWGVPIVWWLLLQEQYTKAGKYVKKVIYTAIWWASGYAGMWLAKWSLGTLVLKRNVFEEAFEKLLVRSGLEGNSPFSARFEAVYANWKHYEYKPYVILLLIWLLVIVILSIRNGVRNNVRGKALLLVSVSPAVWYFIMTGHSIVHHIFTYRVWGISILAILALLLIGTEPFAVQEKSTKAKIILGWGVCAALAVGLSVLPKEDVYVINGYAEFDEVPVSEGEICEMSFTPSFPTIDNFALCAKPDSIKGKCKIVVMDGEEKLYEEYIPLNKYQDTAFAGIPVSWKLSKGKTYSMQISFEGTSGDTYMLITKDHNMVLAEYGEAFIKDVSKNGQILSALNYRYRALSKYTLCSMWVAWTTVLFAVLLTFFIRDKKEMI